MTLEKVSAYDAAGLVHNYVMAQLASGRTNASSLRADGMEIRLDELGIRPANIDAALEVLVGPGMPSIPLANICFGEEDGPSLIASYIIVPRLGEARVIQDSYLRERDYDVRIRVMGEGRRIPLPRITASSKRGPPDSIKYRLDAEILEKKTKEVRAKLIERGELNPSEDDSAKG